MLGPVTASEGAATLNIGGPKQRTVLAILVARPGDPISVDSIINAVWGDEPPPNARRIVQTYVATLRASVGDVIAKMGSGWRLVVARDEIDATVFEDLYKSASDVLDSNPRRASIALREALAMWRGHPYSDIDAHGALEGEVARLIELRVAAQAARVDADLALGRDADLVGEIEALMVEHPYSERFRAQHMLALYRSGRQQEALRSYEYMRTLLLEELGVDPTHELRDLVGRILEQDDSLRAAPTRTIQRRAILVADPGDPIEIGHLPADEREDLLNRTTNAIQRTIDGNGDGFAVTAGTTTYAVFDTAQAAADAAQSITLRLDEPAVRIAIDWGDLVMEGGQVSGPPVSRASVMAAAAHRGQVLLSADAQQSIASSGTGRGLRFENLGTYDLHGVEASVLVYQLLVGDAPPLFPDLETNSLPPPLPGRGDRSVPGYELREAAGPGSVGTLYRAFQPTVGREVLIEVIGRADSSDIDFVRRFEADAQRLSLLDHHNIASVIDYWRHPDGAFLVYRYPRGGFLSTGPNVDINRVVEQVGSALAYAHSLGMWHGSLRPDRVALDEAGNASLLCFPVAGVSAVPVDEYRHYVAPEADGEEITPAVDIYALGVLAGELGFDAPVVERAIDVDPGSRPSSVAEFLVELNPAGSDSPEDRYTETRNPYKGLMAFQETDAADFFGRTAVTAELCQALSDSRLLVIVGPSGIGKSSVARAGLIPAVRSGRLPGSEKWLITDMLPGSHPFLELQRALQRVAIDLPVGLTEALAAQEPDALHDVSTMLPGGADLLILVDQFEELFTMVPEPERAAFLDLLERSIRDGSVRFVLTLRADFLDRPLRYSGFGGLVKASAVMLAAPSPDELIDVIAHPARRVGVEVAPELVERMVGEIRSQPGGLPLLQHTLAELFASRDSDLLGIHDYESIGGVSGSLGRRAEAIYGNLDDDENSAIRQVFLRLVTIVDETAPTRRRVRMTELADLDAARPIEAFSRNRLLVLDSDPETHSPTLEIAHEALLTHWPRLAAWVDATKADLTMVRRLDEARVEWETGGRDPANLLSGGRLAQHLAWTSSTALVLSEADIDFLDESVARSNAEAGSRRRTRRRIVAGFATAATLATALAWVAVWQRGIAETEARQEDVRRLAALATLALDEDPERAILIALEAANVSRRVGEEPRPEAIGALHQAMQTSRLEMRFENDIAIGFGPKGELVTAEQKGPMDSLPRNFLMPVAALSPDGRFFAERVLTPGDKFDVWEILVWDAVTGEEIMRLVPQPPGDSYVGLDLSWHPDGDHIVGQVIGKKHSSVRIWEVPTGRELASFASFPNNVSYAFVDSQTLALPMPSGKGVLLYDIGTGKEVDRLDTPDYQPVYLAHDPKRNVLVLGSQANSPIQAWDLGSKEMIWSVDLPNSFWPTIHSETGVVAIGGNDALIRLLDIDTASEVAVLRGPTEITREALFSPDGSSLATRTLNEGLMWDISPAGPGVSGVIDIGPPTSLTGQLASAPEEDQVAVLSRGSLAFIDVVTGGRREMALTGEGFGELEPISLTSDWSLVGAYDVDLADDWRGWVLDVETMGVVMELPCAYPMNFNTSGDALVVDGTACLEGSSRVITVPSGEEILDLGSDEVFGWPGAVFNPGGVFEADRHLAVTRGDRVEIYDMRGRRLLTTLQRGAAGLAFDPTGRYLAGGGGDGAWVVDMEQVANGAAADDAVVFADPVDPGGLFAIINADGILATSASGSLRLWDIDTGQQVIQVPVTTTDFPFTIFPRAGDHLLYVDQGERGYVLRRFPLDPDEIIELAENRVTRGFTEAECRRYELSDEACTPGSP